MADSRAPEPDEPPKSVLQELESRTGQAPKLLLHGSDSVVAGGSPYVDPQSVDKSLLPKGRGNYQILGEIARGGMGTVLKGHDTDLGRDVALKVLEGDKAQSATIVQRFVEEAQIGGQLQHPGIVPVYELGLMADERPYFTMKLVKGRTLSALLAQRKTLDEDRHRFLSIFESVCQTVAYAHSKGVIHRDLKPANVMVGAFGEVQVVDWGLAKVLGRGGVEDERRALESQQSIIETVRSGPGSTGSDSIAGSVMGTPAYMPPEQAAGVLDKVDERSDVFALGAVLCEILTGRAPYVDDDTRELLLMAGRAALDDALARLDASGADEELRRLCTECMTPARQLRPQNAEEVARRVHDYLASTEQRAHDAELRATAARVRTRATVLVGLVVVLALVGGGWGYLAVERARDARVEEARLALDLAEDEVGSLQAGERHAEAVEVARGALRVVETVEGGAALVARAGTLVAGAEAEREAHAAGLERERRNRAFVERLDAIRNRDGIGNAEISASYDAAFREYGLDMGVEDLSPTIDVMLESGIPEEFALALDDWARWRTWNTDDDPYLAERLLYLAIDLDPHPVRREIREGILAKDGAALAGLARAARFDELGPDGQWFLCVALMDEGQGDALWFALQRALEAHPEDFLLQRLAAEQADDPELELLHASIARSLRPDSVHANSALGWRAMSAGDFATAERAFRRSLELEPDQMQVLESLGGALTFLGRPRDAVQAYERWGGDDPRVRDSTSWLSARYLVGQASRAELIDVIEGEHGLSDGGTGLLYTLIAHPEAGAQDFEYVIQRSDEHARITRVAQVHFLAAYAAARLGRFDDVLPRIERAIDPSRAQRRFDAVVIAALQSAGYAGLGRTEEARAQLERAESLLGRMQRAHPEDWGRGSPPVLFTDLARELIAR